MIESTVSRRRLRVIVAALWLCVAGACRDPGRRIERITAEQAEFTVTVAGTADHWRMGPGWKNDPGSAHNPTRLLRISNCGDRSVINPRVIVDGGPDWFDIEHIVAEIVRPGMSDQEKSFALWQWVRRNLSDGPTFNGPIWGETRSMTRFMNMAGTGACGTYHIVMPVIGKHAGLQTFSGCFADCSHAVQREFFDGQERFLDAHIPHEAGQPGGWFALKLNNAELAGVDDIMRDRYLIERAGGGADRWGYMAYFGPGCRFHEEKPAVDPHSMAMTLRPGESIVWQWHLSVPPWKRGDETEKADRHGSGYVEFRPRLTEQQVRYCAEAAENIVCSALQGEAVVGTRDASKPARMIYRLRCPYPMTGATAGGGFEIAAGGRAMIEYSFDGHEYKPLWTAAGPGPQSPRIALPDDDRFHEPRFTHDLWFCVVIEGAGTCTTQLAFRCDFQAYRPSLPSLRAGRNVIRYTGNLDTRDDGPPVVSNGVIVEYKWRDLPSLPVPKPPAEPVHPAPGGRFGFNETLRWQAAEVAAPAGIAGYEVYISPRADLAWPVMPNTHRITSGAAPAMQLVSPDVLRHGATYYWRVRGRSTDGVWGDWSPTWSFVASGPDAPDGLRVHYDENTGATALTWSPASGGTPVDHYEVHASGEHGFSPLRASEKGIAHGTIVDRPMTLVATTNQTTWDASARPEVFYRVVAVDVNGNRSTPTPVVKAPSPALLPLDLPPARVGQGYRFRLPARLRTGRFALSLRKGIIIDGADAPKFALPESSGVGWLTIDATTGELIAPSPPTAGQYEFVVHLEDGRGGKCERRYVLPVQP